MVVWHSLLRRGAGTAYGFGERWWYVQQFDRPRRRGVPDKRLARRRLAHRVTD